MKMRNGGRRLTHVYFIEMLIPANFDAHIKTFIYLCNRVRMDGTMFMTQHDKTRYTQAYKIKR